MFAMAKEARWLIQLYSADKCPNLANILKSRECHVAVMAVFEIS